MMMKRRKKLASELKNSDLVNLMVERLEIIQGACVVETSLNKKSQRYLLTQACLLGQKRELEHWIQILSATRH